MRLEIRYTNEFTYRQVVRESHNLLRACPTTTATQTLLSYRASVSPEAKLTSYFDFWGTRVDQFGIRRPHNQLSVLADATVDTAPHPVPLDGAITDYASLTSDHVLYLQPSPHAHWTESISQFAKESAAQARSAVELIDAISNAVNQSVTYEPGATYVGVGTEEIFDQRQGVCQDFAHLTIAMLRSLEVPARYVSGYLYAADQTDAVQPQSTELAVQTHAWVEVLLPNGDWWAIDPTNPQPVGELHVKIGHGRDYEDVMPLRGVYHGETEHDLDVRVRISREQIQQEQTQQ